MPVRDPFAVYRQGVGYGALARATQGYFGLEAPPLGLLGVDGARSFARLDLYTVARCDVVVTVARSFPMRTFAAPGSLATMARGEALTTCARGDTEDEGQANG